ncbi:actin-binding protein WASF2-like [Watersipora subatra]|uniref:actin-binding protein WASF2-like n=1 Tax=Watersipora subatra TaxID=2589382 RepID=UPI00355BD99A
MPMLKRPIEPSAITRSKEGSIPSSIVHELEYVANVTQANLIRQLSSLSQHAEDMFRELFEEATVIYKRTCNLTNKVDTLRESVQQFDPNQVVVKLTDITKRKPYKTDYHTDQQICTKSTMPRSLQHMYSTCAPPPKLEKFDKFRTDGKSSIKMYTNPDHFIHLWVESIQKETTKKHDGKKVKKRPSRRGENKEIRNVMSRSEKYKAMAHGKEFVPAKSSDEIAAEKQVEKQRKVSGVPAQAPSNGQLEEHRASQSPAMSPPAPPAPVVDMASQKADKYQDMIYDYGMTRPDATSPPQHSANMAHLSHTSVTSQSPSMNRMTMPPPPPPPSGQTAMGLPPPPSPPSQSDIGIVPPPPPMMPMHGDIGAIRPASPPPIDSSYSYMAAGVPPPPAPISPNVQVPGPASVPPPPPPPPPSGVPGLPPPPPAPPVNPASAGPAPGTSSAALSAAAKTLRSTADIPKPEPVKDERSDLLAQIRLGIQLRGAEERKTENTGTLDSKKAMLGTFDVQSIMDKVQEMRRHLESDESGSDDDSNWSDSDYD